MRFRKRPLQEKECALTLGPMEDTERRRTKESTAYRLVTAAGGVVFIGASIAIVIVSEITIGPAAASVAIGMLGVDAVVSAYRNRPSLLSRVGPLP